jgi:hypothetical protein
VGKKEKNRMAAFVARDEGFGNWTGNDDEKVRDVGRDQEPGL